MPATMPEADMTWPAVTGATRTAAVGEATSLHLWITLVTSHMGRPMLDNKTRTEGLELLQHPAKHKRLTLASGVIANHRFHNAAKHCHRKARLAQRGYAALFLRCKGPSLRPYSPSHQVWQEGWSVAQVPTKWSLKGLASSLNWMNTVYLYVHYIFGCCFTPILLWSSMFREQTVGWTWNTVITRCSNKNKVPSQTIPTIST